MYWQLAADEKHKAYYHWINFYSLSLPWLRLILFLGLIQKCGSDVRHINTRGGGAYDYVNTLSSLQI